MHNHPVSKRIGILTGGGDCPGLNAAIRAIVRAAQRQGWGALGIKYGFEGLYKEEYVDLSQEMPKGLLSRGGTILGSSNRANPFAYRVSLPDGREEIQDVSAVCLQNLKKLDLEGLVVIGGDGTQSFAHRFVEMGAKIVGVPKTIDNDLEATDYTIGFQTAVEVVTDALDRLKTTAESHDRIMICEVMGRYAGWIGLTAGVAGGANVILIPEMDYDIERVVAAIDQRVADGHSSSIIVVAEGAKPIGGHLAVEKAGDETRQEKLGGAGERLAGEISSRTSYEARVTVLGHIQRGGTPCAFDRELASRFGVKAVELVAEGAFGSVAALRAQELVSKPMSQAVAKLKRVSADSNIVATARALGIELGTN